MTDLLFRWGLWNPTPQSVEMLGHSIGTFRRFFGKAAEYLVTTDNPDLIRALLRIPATVAPLDGPDAEYVDARATWKKWAPRFRWRATATEIRVDADIFLLQEPVEIREFIADDGTDYLVTQEEYTERWPYGNFGPRLAANFSPINAGLFGQRAGHDLSEELRTAYQWWSDHVRDHEVLYHDEQGAISWILQRHIVAGRVRLLDPARYRVVCPTNAVPVESVDGLVGLHATYPDHPAYHRFHAEICRVSGLPAASDVTLSDAVNGPTA